MLAPAKIALLAHASLGKPEWHDPDQRQDETKGRRLKTTDEPSTHSHPPDFVGDSDSGTTLGHRHYPSRT